MNELLTVLESKYKRLEYIQSTGTQYIDTGVKSSSDLVVDTEYYYESGYFFGYSGTIDGVNKSYGYPSDSNNSYLRIGGGYVFQNSEWGTNKWLKLHIENERNSVTLNGVIFSNSGGNFGTVDFSNGGNITLGRYAGTNFVGKIKYFNVKQNGVFIRQLVPVLRKSDNEIGMLDLIEGKFYPNAGTGKFTANLDVMYALIQGTPTVQDGRVSGFSIGSCLLTAQEIGNRPFELVTKINLTTMGYLSPIFVGNGNPSLTFHIDSSKLKMQIGDGTSWISSIILGTTILSTNTDYYVKLVFDGTKFIGYLSTNNTNWTKEVEWVNTISTLPTYKLKIGNDRSSSTYYLRGTIDLNRSYIKIDDTKYKLGVAQ